jgi:hypothetical protein
MFAQDEIDIVDPEQEEPKIIKNLDPETPELLGDDSLDAPKMQVDSVAIDVLTDSISTNGTQQFNLSNHHIKLHKKDFKGTGFDITLGAIVIGCWLVVMWVAANQ